MDSNRNPPPPKPITWLTYLYTSIVYYFWLIYAHLPRITDDKSTGDADTQTSLKAPRLDEETQTARQVAGPLSAPKDSSLSPSPPTSFDRRKSSCNNCLTPHSKKNKTSCSYVSNLSTSTTSSQSSSRQSSIRKKKHSYSSSTSSTSSSSTILHRSPPSPTSSISSESTIVPSSSPNKIIALVPSGSHVLVRVPKLDSKTESIRIKRTRMSDWLDAEQRDVMRQFDEVIEEAEDQKTSGGDRRGILKIQSSGVVERRNGYGYSGSVRSVESSSSRSKFHLVHKFEYSSIQSY
ncbi:unnamed protein product [Caenorhabditis brenneri]